MGPIQICRWMLIIGVVSAALTGCTESVAPQVNNPSVIDFSRMTAEAKQQGADPSQIAILEKGEVSFTDYEAAVTRALFCMAEQGMSVIEPEMDDSTGIMLLHYSWSPDLPGLTQDQGTALGDDCLLRFSWWVEMLWQVQPSSIEAQEQFFTKYRDAVILCIRAHGGTVRDDASREEAATATANTYDKSGVDCFEEIGISL